MQWTPPSRPQRQAGGVHCGNLSTVRAVVTGGNRGVGYFVAEQLATVGAEVVVATRSDASAALQSIRQRVPGARLTSVHLDLSSLPSVAAAAHEMSGLGPIDVLINNAGLTGGSNTRAETADGLELIVGTNHLGPFALTAQLFPALSETARVVSLGSLSTRLAKADLDDLMATRRRYSLSRAYATSKHAVHAFALELDRRLRAAGSAKLSLLAHPGFALDALGETVEGVTDLGSKGSRFGEYLLAPMAQGKDKGAWPVVRAATDPDAVGGEFYGPRRLVRGIPTVQKPVAQSADPEFGRRLWTLSEELTGVRFDV